MEYTSVSGPARPSTLHVNKCRSVSFSPLVYNIHTEKCTNHMCTVPHIFKVNTPM